MSGASRFDLRATLLALPKRSAMALIRLYQLTLSPMLGPRCRFEPSCSHYACACYASHGFVRGSWLTLKRLGRCHPFHPGGYDPPPEALPAGPSSTSRHADEVAASTREGTAAAAAVVAWPGAPLPSGPGETS